MAAQRRDRFSARQLVRRRHGIAELRERRVPLDAVVDPVVGQGHAGGQAAFPDAPLDPTPLAAAIGVLEPDLRQRIPGHLGVDIGDAVEQDRRLVGIALVVGQAVGHGQRLQPATDAAPQPPLAVVGDRQAAVAGLIDHAIPVIHVDRPQRIVCRRVLRIEQQRAIPKLPPKEPVFVKRRGVERAEVVLRECRLAVGADHLPWSPKDVRLESPPAVRPVAFAAGGAANGLARIHIVAVDIARQLLGWHQPPEELIALLHPPRRRPNRSALLAASPVMPPGIGHCMSPHRRRNCAAALLRPRPWQASNQRRRHADGNDKARTCFAHDSQPMCFLDPEPLRLPKRANGLCLQPTPPQARKPPTDTAPGYSGSRARRDTC